MKVLLALLACGVALAQPVIHTQLRNGVMRAEAWHAASGRPVTDEDRAAPGEAVFVRASSLPFAVRGWSLWNPLGLAPGVAVSINGQKVAGATIGGQLIVCVLPADAGGSFVELSVIAGQQRSNIATIPVRALDDPTRLSASDVDGIVIRAAVAIDDPRMAIAVVDRFGRPLATYRKPLATDADVEIALSLARTGAFFSNGQAPLSSRTVNTISREHFPNGIPNQPAAALFGIENTNRGCDLNATFLSDVPPARNAAGTGFGPGITVIPGGIPVFKSGPLVGGLGVAGIDPDAAEFAAVSATAGTPFFVTQPLPPPGAVFINGVRLPFVQQTSRPAGTAAASTPGGVYQFPVRDGGAAPEGYLAGPAPGATLSEDEVRGIIQRAVDRANKTRAVIRLPLGSRAKFVVALTDLDGNILGLYRMPDSTVFSIDVAVAKARNVVYFSSAAADPRDLPGVPAGTAVTNRTIGFGAQSFFPSGIDDSSPGPFRDLYLFDVANPCTQGRQPANLNQSGVIFFPGSAPLYRNGVMIGGLGVSGDGVEQDDYVTAGGAEGFEPPESIRADQVFIRGVRLPYFKFLRNPEQ